MSKPSIVFRWADVGGSLVAPSTGLTNTGWAGGDKPEAEHIDYLLNLLGLWIAYINAGVWDGDTTFNNKLTVLGQFIPTGGIHGTAAFDAGITVAGAATLASVAVTGNATVGGTLGVTGAATLASAAVTGAITVGAAAVVSGALTTLTSFSCTGDISIGTGDLKHAASWGQSLGADCFEMVLGTSIVFVGGDSHSGAVSSGSGLSFFNGTAVATLPLREGDILVSITFFADNTGACDQPFNVGWIESVGGASTSHALGTISQTGGNNASSGALSVTHTVAASELIQVYYLCTGTVGFNTISRVRFLWKH